MLSLSESESCSTEMAEGIREMPGVKALGDVAFWGALASLLISDSSQCLPQAGNSEALLAKFVSI